MNSIVRFVKENCGLLRSSEMTFADIYRISFAAPEKVMAEYSEGTYIRRKTYGEIRELAETAAAALSKRLRRCGEYVGIYAENSYKWIVLFWAVLKSGNKPYLINLMQPESFTRGVMSTLRAEHLVFVGKAPGLCENEYSYEELASENDGQESGSSSFEFGDEIAITTSGTTLQEKVCVFTGREISLQILNCDEILKTNKEMRAFYNGSLKMLMFLPLYHIFGLEASYLWFCFFGVTFVFLPNMTPDAILHTIRRHEVTHVFAVPLLWHSIERAIERELSSKDDKTRARFEKGISLSLKLQSAWPLLGRRFAERAFREVRSRVFGDSIRFCISGGSYLKDSTIRLINGIGYPLYNGYGMSEIGITSVELSRNAGDRIKNSIGKPFSSVRYQLDSEGRLTVTGGSVCKKLFVNGEPQETDGSFLTGDIMTCDRQGRYYIKGRASDLIYGPSGEKLNPDIAEKAYSLPLGAVPCVLGDSSNERLMLVVQIPTTLVGLQRRRITEAVESCTRSLPANYRVSAVYYTFDPIMREGDIKVSRAYLRKCIDDGSVKLFSSCDEAAEAVDDVDSEIKKILRECVAKVLGVPVEQVRDNAHFINDLGGSSLDYFTLIAEIDTRFEVTMSYEADSFGYTLIDMEKTVKELICRS